MLLNKSLKTLTSRFVNNSDPPQVAIISYVNEEIRATVRH